MLLSKTALLLLALPFAEPANGVAPFDSIRGFAPASVKFDDLHGKGFAWNKALPCGANHATVTVKFDKTYNSSNNQYAPIAKVWLHSGRPGDPSEQWVAAALKAPTDTWKLNGLLWLEKVIGSDSEAAGGYAPADLNHPVLIDFTWTPAGLIKVTFDGEFVKQVVTDKPITGIGFGGSWSKFEFIDLQVGRVGDPDPMCVRRTIASSALVPATN